MSLTDIATVAGIIFGFIASLSYLESLGVFSLRTLNSTRSKTLATIAECSLTFNEFYRSLISPDGAYQVRDRNERYQLSFITSSPLIVFAVLTIEATLLPPLSASSLSNLLIVLILSYPVSLLFLVTAGVFLVRRADRIRRSTNGLIFIYSQLRSLNAYLLFILFLYLITPIREFQNTIEGISTLAQVPILAALILALLGFYIAGFLVFRLFKDSLIRELEYRFYNWSPQRGLFTVELTIALGRNQPQQTVRGTILGIGQTLLIRRNDGLVQAIRWKGIRAIAATPRDNPPPQ